MCVFNISVPRDLLAIILLKILSIINVFFAAFHKADKVLSSVLEKYVHMSSLLQNPANICKQGN